MNRGVLAGAVAGAIAGGTVVGMASLLRSEAPPAPAIRKETSPEEVDHLRSDLDRVRRDLADLRASLPAIRSPASTSVPGRAAEISVPAPAGPSAADILPAGTPSNRIAEARIAAERIRASAAEWIRQSEQEAARGVAADMEKERRVMEDAARGGTMTLLRSLQKEGAHLPELVGDPEKFAALFRRSIAGPSRTDADWKPREPFEDGTTVVLSEGVHSWDGAGYEHRKSFPADVLLRGAGMDKTLLRLNELASGEEVQSLNFEDLTLDCSNNYMTDLRSENPATIRMTRCRIVGFDMGAGGSVMFAARTGAFLAEDCRFEAGYSRTPAGFGNLFRVGRGLLVRMDRCLLRGPFRSVYDSNEAATYRFEGCAFTEIETGTRSAFEKPPEGVAFTGCTFDYLPAEEVRNERKPRPLTDFNPAWK